MGVLYFFQLFPYSFPINILASFPPVTIKAKSLTKLILVLLAAKAASPSIDNGKFSQDNKPVFLQKDFDGVANIFAPNIIVQNPPLTSDGYPDITFDM